jgi:hypothetical protein
MTRFAGWLLVGWTVLMALGIYAAYLGIGGDCGGLTGTAVDACRADAWGRGSIGLLLLGGLWLVVAVPFWFIWNRGRTRMR